MTYTEKMLIDLKNELRDEGVFSPDQIAALEAFADNLNELIYKKIEEFASYNFR